MLQQPNCYSLSLFPTQVLEDQQNIRLIRELLQTLYTSLCTLVQRVGKCVLVGNINMWVHRMEAILHWQQQLNNIQITRVSRTARSVLAQRFRSAPPRRCRAASPGPYLRSGDGRAWTILF